MKELTIPYIPGLESLGFKDLDRIMEEKAANDEVGVVDWPEEFPYKPDVKFAVARSDKHIVIRYSVEGLDLRAKALEDNGPVWEDSCCEFFVSDPQDGSYYNFELNCIGVLLAAKRKSRQDYVHFETKDMKRILRHSTLDRKEYGIDGEMFRWKTAICIPLDMIGIDPENLPAFIRANVYKCGDKTAHTHFLSWNKVETETPDFHRPEYFGKMYF